MDWEKLWKQTRMEMFEQGFIEACKLMDKMEAKS